MKIGVFLFQNFYYICFMKLLIKLLVLSLFLTSCGKPKIVQSTVLSHDVISNKYGDRTYITIVRTDDGYIVEKTGLSYYAIPVGDKIKIEVWR